MNKNILTQIGFLGAMALAALVGMASPASADIFVVTRTNDNDGPCTTTNLLGCSLRQAISAANATAETDRIHFNIPACGARFINSGSTLRITRRVIIDGDTQPLCGDPVPGDPTSFIELRGPGSNVFPGGDVLHGLVLEAGSGGSQIRGLAINGFSGAGIGMVSSNNFVVDSKLGTTATGRIARPNSIGIGIGDTSNNNDVADSVISGNTSIGINVLGDGNQFYGNLIGTTVDGDPLPNGDGISTFGANGNEIGIASSLGNTIAFNSGIGVRIGLGNSNLIIGNSIFDNGGLGIDLIGGGANSNQAAPVLTSVSVVYDFIPGNPPRIVRRTTVQGTLAGVTGTGFLVDLYGNDVCDPSGNGEGKKFLATASVNANGTFVVSTTSSTGPFVSGVARSPDDDTSQFSNCREVN